MRPTVPNFIGLIMENEKKPARHEMLNQFMEYSGMKGCGETHSRIHCHCGCMEGACNCCCSDRNHIPGLGEQAPEFTAMTTQGPISFPGDFAGKWVILLSYSGDFTPVCTTELLTLGARTEEFAEMNCQLLGLSIDSNASHIAWLRNIAEKVEYRGMKNVKVDFPIIDDSAAVVARKFGMVHSLERENRTVRAVFFIDPMVRIRTILFYPPSVGRNIDEIKRILLALQTSEQFGVSTPADWHPGDNVIVPGSRTYSCTYDPKPDEVECEEWYFCTKPLSKELIWDALIKKK